MRGVFTFIFIASSLFQFFACMNGIGYSFHTGGVMSFILAVVFNWLPFVGSLFGIVGAYNVWHWGLFVSILLFIWPTVLTILLAFLYRNRVY